MTHHRHIQTERQTGERLTLGNILKVTVGFGKGFSKVYPTYEKNSSHIYKSERTAFAIDAVAPWLHLRVENKSAQQHIKKYERSEWYNRELFHLAI